MTSNADAAGRPRELTDTPTTAAELRIMLLEPAELTDTQLDQLLEAVNEELLDHVRDAADPNRTLTAIMGSTPQVTDQNAVPGGQATATFTTSMPAHARDLDRPLVTIGTGAGSPGPFAPEAGPVEPPSPYAELVVQLGPGQPWGTAKGRVPPDQAHHLITTFGIVSIMLAAGAVITLRVAAGLTAVAYAALGIACACAVLIAIRRFVVRAGQRLVRSADRPPGSLGGSRADPPNSDDSEGKATRR
jgi:hypothetical protein